MRAQNLPSAPPRILHFEARVIRFEARVILPLVIPSQHFLTEALSYRGQCSLHGHSGAGANSKHLKGGRLLGRHPPKVSSVECPQLVGGSLLCTKDVQHVVDSAAFQTTIRCALERVQVFCTSELNNFLSSLHDVLFNQATGLTWRHYRTDRQGRQLPPPEVVACSCQLQT